jgi:hypothetical protein
MAERIFWLKLPQTVSSYKPPHCDKGASHTQRHKLRDCQNGSCLVLPLLQALLLI